MHAQWLSRNQFDLLGHALRNVIIRQVNSHKLKHLMFQAFSEWVIGCRYSVERNIQLDCHDPVSHQNMFMFSLGYS